jgi:outer membrane protein assembly factor BamB
LRFVHPALVVLALSAHLIAQAESVPVGRYVELPVGRAIGHAYPSSAGGVRRTGRSRFAAPAAAPARQWVVIKGERAFVPPAVRADGTLLVGTRQGVLAFDPTGALLWAHAFGSVRFTPALSGAGEAVVIAAGTLRVLSHEGKARDLALPGRVGGMPLLLESGVVVAAGVDGQAHVLGLDGAYQARVPLSDRAPRFSAFLGHELLAIAGEGALLSLLSPHGGSERTVRLPAPLTTAPIVTPERTLLGLTSAGSVIEVDAAGSVASWAEFGTGVLAQGPALGRDGGLRVGLRHGELLCMGPGGSERWRRGIDGQPSAITLDRDDTAVVISSRGTLYAIDAAGELRWRVSTELLQGGRPVLGADGLVYLVGRGGRLEAWR